MALILRCICSLWLWAYVSQIAANPRENPQPPATARVVGRKQTLGAVLGEIEATHGIRVQLASDLAKDPIRLDPATSHGPGDVAALLKGYNWLGTQDAQGRLVSITVTGRNGDGTDPALDKPALPPLLTYRKNPARLPQRYRQYPPGSVFPIDIPVKQLRDMALGERVALNLPGGQYDLRHDNAWPHANGDRTWVARAENETDALYRTLITLGDGDAIDGQIRTPNGLYQLESDETGQWLIDINATGFQQGAFEQDGQWPPLSLPPSALIPVSGSQASTGRGSLASKAGFGGAATGGQNRPVIDVLLLYTDGMDRDGVGLRLNSLIALANQALADSQAQVVVRRVAARRLDYPDATANRQALDQLTQHQGAFRSVAQLREEAGADLVLLVRAFKPKSQAHSCGEAWVNGSGGAPLSPDLAFGVVNDGRADGYYCSNYTLAHELGHLLGAAHDRRHAKAPGHFAYSYGFGVQGWFGDIMSYYHPEVGVYANPELQVCGGSACGIAIGQREPADVVATFNRTARVIETFAASPSD